MKVDSWLKQAVNKLEKAGIGSARLDVLILLEDECSKDRSYVLAHPEIVLSKTRIKRLNSRLARRQKHLPMAYIRGFSEFYGRKFKVNRHVLEPRPESETMIELLKQLVEGGEWRVGRKLTVADVGTGSGAIGIAVALEIPGAVVDLYDIDANALAVAKHNMVMHELHLKVYKRDLLTRPVREYEVILANLPYVPNRWQINEAAAMEPRIAIFGGGDGLDLYRRLFKQLAKMDQKPQFVFTESLPPQHIELARLAAESRYKLIQSQDFIQIFEKG